MSGRAYARQGNINILIITGMIISVGIFDVHVRMRVEIGIDAMVGNRYHNDWRNAVRDLPHTYTYTYFNALVVGIDIGLFTPSCEASDVQFLNLES